MEIREIKGLIALMRENGLIELEIEDKKGKVRLVRANETAAVKPQPLARQAAPKVEAGGGKAGKAAIAPQLAKNQKLVASPMVGTFYRAASPDAEPFVEEGSLVKKGQPLCIIEAMKMMNEIEAEFAGKVAKILCENGQPVEYGQPLIILQVAG